MTDFLAYGLIAIWPLCLVTVIGLYMWEAYHAPPQEEEVEIDDDADRLWLIHEAEVAEYDNNFCRRIGVRT